VFSGTIRFVDVGCASTSYTFLMSSSTIGLAHICSASVGGSALGVRMCSIWLSYISGR
jgi:hypothetical protein